MKIIIQAEADRANRTPAKTDFHSPVGPWNSVNVCRKLARYTATLHNRLLCTVTQSRIQTLATSATAIDYFTSELYGRLINLST